MPLGPIVPPSSDSIKGDQPNYREPRGPDAPAPRVEAVKLGGQLDKQVPVWNASKGEWVAEGPANFPGGNGPQNALEPRAEKTAFKPGAEGRRTLVVCQVNAVGGAASSFTPFVNGVSIGSQTQPKVVSEASSELVTFLVGPGEAWEWTGANVTVKSTYFFF